MSTSVQTNPWAQAYLAEFDRRAAVLPRGRRDELRSEVVEYLDIELASVSQSQEAAAILDRLGDPAQLVAEAAADIPPAGKPRSGTSAAEITALLLLGIGGVVLPLLAPLVAVAIMSGTPRWNSRQIRVTLGIVLLGFAALAGGLILLATTTTPSGFAVLAGLLFLMVVVLVGPAAALYAGTRRSGTDDRR